MEAGWSTAESVARESRGRLVAILAKKLGDVNAAEDALADAFGKALESWPENGVPEHPEAWLIAVAQRRVIDAQRHSKVAAANEEDLAWLTQEYAETSSDTDSRIELLFVCTHPAIDPSIRTPLMLQTVLGVTAEVMAPLWLTPASTIGQRLVRAKSKIAKAAIPFTVPAPHERQQRLDAVLAAIYGALTIGNEDLALEAEYLAALLASAFPDEPEALGLLALCLYRLALADDVAPGPLAQRSTERWDHERIARAESLLNRAAKKRTPGRYQLEAAIQSAHIVGRLEHRDLREAIVSLYRRLETYAPSLGARCGLAAALIEANQTEDAEDALASVADTAADYQPFYVVKARLSEVQQKVADTRLSLERALLLSTDDRSSSFIRDWLDRL
ncbi:MAG: DUF6596 domain-containing protein [Pseudomonadota bacterium]